MPESGTDKLKGAYALKTPEDNTAFYRDFARTYDDGFAVETGYVYPREVARVFLERAEPADRPILDVGAGTGLLAEWLGRKVEAGQIDGIDISPEMLAKAAAKGLYHRRINADLTQDLDIPDARYGAVVSSGTFTHGHVGPAAFGELLRIARPGALFCIGINLEVYDAAGFGSALARLTADGRITPVDFTEVRYYEGVEHEHSEDHGLAALFRKR